MITLHGIPASPGVAIGPAWLYQKVQLAAYEELSRLTAQAEQRRFDCAVQEARAQLDRLYEKTVREAGEAAAQIFDIHKMMMEDLDYLESVEDNITNQLYTAEHAVACAGQEFAEMFASMDDEVMRARSADIRDITQRLLQVLTGGQSQALKESSVVCAHDLFPSDTMQLEREHVMAFVTELGSHVSHSAILARTMGIPAVVGVGGLVEALSAASGTVVVDGSQGLVILDADEQTLADYSARRQAYLREQTDLQVYRDLPSRTKDGLELEICANIAYVTDADNAAAVRADGVGLMRSEFLYMNADSAPDEDTQFAAYRAVLEKLEGKRVVVRTLDIGADKVPPWLPLPPEENPAMGWRAVRMCLDHRDMFRTQLRALLRASHYGRLAIMFPMIGDLDQLRRAKALLAECRRELEAEQVPLARDIEVGMMVEVPSAAILADQFAQEVDFFSIGTNDLTQYTLAADRLNDKVADLFDSSHPAVLRLIQNTAQAAAARGIWCGICGESAGNEALLPFYIKAGVRELSVVPGKVLELRRALSAIDASTLGIAGLIGTKGNYGTYKTQTAGASPSGGAPAVCDSIGRRRTFPAEGNAPAGQLLLKFLPGASGKILPHPAVKAEQNAAAGYLIDKVQPITVGQDISFRLVIEHHQHIPAPAQLVGTNQAIGDILHQSEFHALAGIQRQNAHMVLPYIRLHPDSESGWQFWNW